MNTNELMKQTCNVFLKRLDLYPKGVKGSIISEPQNELIRVKNFPQILKEKATIEVPNQLFLNGEQKMALRALYVVLC